MSLTDTKHKRRSLVITIILLVTLLFLMFYMRHKLPRPASAEHMIKVNFGPVDHGSGSKPPMEKAEPEPLPKQVKPRETTSAKPEEREEEVIASDEEEVPVIPPQGSIPKETPETTPRKEAKPVWEDREPVEGTEKLSKLAATILSHSPNSPGADASTVGEKGKDAVTIAAVKGQPGEQTYYCSCGIGYVFYDWGKNGKYTMMGSSPQEIVNRKCLHRRQGN